VKRTPSPRELVGVDIFFDFEDRSADHLAERLREVTQSSGLALVMITNRGVKVWPNGLPETFCTDHWRCRFMAADQGGVVTHAQIVDVLQRVIDAGLDFIKIENLCTFDGQPGYSMGQGQ
jgi:isocitrate dehydrogenase